jgi:hypothetical protein
MMYLVENAEQLRPGIWAGKIAPRYLEHLSDGLTPVAPYSIVAAKLNIDGNRLAFSPDDAQLLSQGDAEDTLFVSVSRESEYSHVRISTTPAARGNTDAAFIEACAQLVGTEFAGLAKELVDAIREKHAGRLTEKQGRKWLNEPNNFVAITIQNRDRSLAISIRAVSEAGNSPLKPKPDRPGYLRFKVTRRADVPEALRLILASARR